MARTPKSANWAKPSHRNHNGLSGLDKMSLEISQTAQISWVKKCIS